MSQWDEQGRRGRAGSRRSAGQGLADDVSWLEDLRWGDEPGPGGGANHGHGIAVPDAPLAHGASAQAGGDYSEPVRQGPGSPPPAAGHGRGGPPGHASFGQQPQSQQYGQPQHNGQTHHGQSPPGWPAQPAPARSGQVEYGQPHPDLTQSRPPGQGTAAPTGRRARRQGVAGAAPGTAAPGAAAGAVGAGAVGAAATGHPGTRREVHQYAAGPTASETRSQAQTNPGHAVVGYHRDSALPSTHQVAHPSVSQGTVRDDARYDTRYGGVQHGGVQHGGVQHGGVQHGGDQYRGDQYRSDQYGGDRQDVGRGHGYHDDVGYSGGRYEADHYEDGHYAADHYSAGHPDDGHYAGNRYGDDWDDDAHGGRRRSPAFLDDDEDEDDYRRRRRRRRRVRNSLSTVAILSLLGVFGWVAWQGLASMVPSLGALDLDLLGPEDYPGPGTGSVEIVVEPGDVAANLADQLVEADVVASREAFISAANVNPDFPSLRPGTYALAQQLPAADAVDALLDPANRVGGGVTIPEGLRAEQILERLSTELEIPYETLEAAALAAELPPEAALPPDLERPPPAIGDIEGWLYPDTYDFGSDPDPNEVIATMVQRTVTELEEIGVPRDRWLTVLTEASLVQAEARLPEDFGRIARVLENRLEFGVPTASGGTVSLLQLDATTNYATGIHDAFTTDEQRDSQNPYNTYQVAGLPPGPINSPSRTAVEATFAPTEGPWLYYLAVNLCTGETVYATTLEEHNSNRQQLQEWVQQNSDGQGGYNCG